MIREKEKQTFFTPESVELPRYSIKLPFFYITGRAVLRAINSLPAAASDAANFHTWTRYGPEHSFHAV